MALLAAVTAAGGCARAPHASQATAPPASSAAPQRVAAPRATGAAGAPSPPTAAPAAAATAARAPAAPTAPASAAPIPAAVVPPAGPQVLSVSTSPEVIHDGEAVAWDVRTTPDVVSVTAHVSAYTLPLVRRSAGRYTLNFSVPANVPGFFHGTYTLDIVARTESGATADRAVSVTFK